MASCKQGCGAPVFWAKRPGKKPYEPGAFVLLDAEPSPVGIYEIIDGRVVPIGHETAPDAKRYTPHSAMCEASNRSAPLRQQGNR